MKKSLVALAVLGTLAGTASAQSSVTLFGVMDAGVAFLKGGGVSTNQVVSGGLNTSRFGLRGTEDLGGGLKANFWLESQVNEDTGTSDSGGKFWNRRATVGLSGDFGEFRIGRDKTSVRNIIDEFDAFGGVGFGDITANSKFSSSNFGVTGNTLGQNRNDNEVRYFLPSNLGGIYGSLDMGYGEGVGGQKLYGGRLGYKEGPLNVTVGASISTLANNAKWGHGAVAASYDFGVVKIGVLGIEAKLAGRKQDVYGVNATVPMGQGVFKVQYAQSNANARAETAATGFAAVYDARLISAAYIYNVSKRTSLYGIVSDLKNKGNGTMVLAISQATPAGLSTPGGTSSGFNVGISHFF
ncbi:porin [Burkholderiaceae bacterium UC74_6]